MTPDEQKKEHLRRYFQEIVCKGNLDAIPDFVSSDLVFWGPYAPEPIRGLKGFTELIAMLRAAFDNFHITEEEMVVEGDTVATRWTASGVRQANSWGLVHLGSRFVLPARGFTGLWEGKSWKHGPSTPAWK